MESVASSANVVARMFVDVAAGANARTVDNRRPRGRCREGERGAAAADKAAGRVAAEVVEGAPATSVRVAASSIIQH